MAKIIVTEQSGDFQAYFDGRAGLWRRGETADSAIGNLIRTFGGHIKVTVEIQKL